MNSHSYVETSNVSDSPSRSSNGEEFLELQSESGFHFEISNSARKVEMSQTYLHIL